MQNMSNMLQGLNRLFLSLRALKFDHENMNFVPGIVQHV